MHFGQAVAQVEGFAAGLDAGGVVPVGGFDLQEETQVGIFGHQGLQEGRTHALVAALLVHGKVVQQDDIAAVDGDPQAGEASVLLGEPHIGAAGAVHAADHFEGLALAAGEGPAI